MSKIPPYDEIVLIDLRHSYSQDRDKNMARDAALARYCDRLHERLAFIETAVEAMRGEGKFVVSVTDTTNATKLGELQASVDRFVKWVEGCQFPIMDNDSRDATFVKNGCSMFRIDILAKLRELGLVRGDEDKRTCGSCSHFTVVHDQGDYSMGRCSLEKFGRSALAYNGHLPCDNWKAQSVREEG